MMSGVKDASFFQSLSLPLNTNLNAELARLRKHKKARAIPKREQGKLLVATWNIANLGAQDRRDQTCQSSPR